MRRRRQSRGLNGRGRRLALAGAAQGSRQRSAGGDGSNTALAIRVAQSRIVVFQMQKIVSPPFGAAPGRRVGGPLPVEASTACSLCAVDTYQSGSCVDFDSELPVHEARHDELHGSQVLSG